VHKILSKLVDECRRYSKPKQCHFCAWLKRPIFGVHDSQGSAETLVRRGGITNYHLIAYSFSNTSAKNYHNQLMCIEVIVCNVSVFFLRHSVFMGKTPPKMLFARWDQDLHLICDIAFSLLCNRWPNPQKCVPLGDLVRRGLIMVMTI